MQIRSAPHHQPVRVRPDLGAPASPVKEQPTDRIELQSKPNEGFQVSKVVKMGACTLAGGAVGAAVGLHGGALATTLAVGLIPGVAAAGVVAGAVAAQQLGPKSWEYRSIGGGLVGGVLGLGAGIAQACLAGTSAGTALAATMAIAGACTGFGVFLKITT